MEEEKQKIRIIKPQDGGQARLCQSNADVIFFGGNLGGGKLLSNNELVLTPNGWVRNGDLKRGDLVSTPFGNPTRIIETYPHKNKDIYTVETSDGRKCLAGLEHLWEVRTKKQIHKYRIHGEHKNFMIITTEQLIDGINKGISYYIQIPNAQEFYEKEFVIHPYLLGILLGDGCLTTLKDRDNGFDISTSEQDIIDRVAEISESYRVYYNKSCYTKTFYTNRIDDYKKYIFDNGLNTYSYNKFIPQEYLWGSIEQRMQLLYGLMDTDGCVEGKNRYTFSTTSDRLAEDFIYLCRSLGYVATKHTDKRHDKYTNGKCFKIVIQTDDIIFSSKKHLERYDKNYDKYIKNRKYGRTNDHVLIKSITYKTNEDALCIYVEDKDHLYIAGDFVTTHNTFGAALAIAEATKDKNFRAVFFRKNLGDTRTAGGLTDTFKECYGDYCSIKMSDTPKISFPSGAQVELRHCALEEPQKIIEIYKGLQADVLYFDELTSFNFHTFTYLMTRNRGKAEWSGHTIASLNPKRNHWVREFLKNHIGADGFIKPEMDGKVVYFYLKGSTVKDIVWGDTKKEVYEQCKIDIDRKLKNFDKEYSYENMIRSFVFILGTLAQNKIMLANNKNYLGAVASSGNMSRALIEGNWDWIENDEEAPIQGDKANDVFFNDSQRNNNKYITVDLADEGTDNMLALVWDGFHVYDKMILSKSTPRENAERTKLLAETHGIGDDHIIFDATAARYFLDYIPDAMPYLSRRSPIGLYGRMAMQLKDECYLRLVNMISHGRISVSENVGQARYFHQNLKQEITFQTEFVEECSVVRFKDVGSGRKRLVNKKEMNAMLGKGRSMDILDAFAMRMLPVAEFEYGTELEKTYVLDKSDEDNEDRWGNKLSIYDSSTWA